MRAISATIESPPMTPEDARNAANSRLHAMDDQADKVIAAWSFGALAANVLPPPFDMIAVGGAFARMGRRMGRVYGVAISWSEMRLLGRAVAKGIGSVVTAGYIGTSMLKLIPRVNIWVALLVQPPMVGAVAYSAGHAFKSYYHTYLTEGRELTPSEVRDLASAALREKLR